MSARSVLMGTVGAIAALAVVLPATAFSASAAPAAPPLSAQAAPTTQYCYTTLLSETSLTQGARNAISCYPSESRLDLAVTLNLGVSRMLADSRVAALSFTNRRLARHYDGAWGSGSSLSVYGTSCSGGGLNLAGTGWEDRISSTRHGACGTIVHYSDAYFLGISELTVGVCGVVVTLGVLPNDSSSIRYFTPESSWCSI